MVRRGESGLARLSRRGEPHVTRNLLAGRQGLEPGRSCQPTAIYRSRRAARRPGPRSSPHPDEPRPGARRAGRRASEGDVFGWPSWTPFEPSDIKKDLPYETHFALEYPLPPARVRPEVSRGDRLPSHERDEIQLDGSMGELNPISAAASFLFAVRTTRRAPVLFTARRTRARPAAFRTRRRTAAFLTVRRTLARPTALRTPRRATAFRTTTRRRLAPLRARRRETLLAIRRSRPRATAPRTPPLVTALFATRLALRTLRTALRSLLLATPRLKVFLIVGPPC